MRESSDTSLPADISLLLRADAEQCWLSHVVIPVLDDLERGGQPTDEQVHAALAYLEAMWDEATARAQETDAALALLRADTHTEADTPDALRDPAWRYHEAVRRLRGIVARRVGPLVESSEGPRETDRVPFAACPRSAEDSSRDLTCKRIRPAQTARSSRPLS